MCADVNHPVPDWVKPSLVIFDIRALWRSALNVRVPDVKKIYKLRLNPLWHRMLYSFTHTAAVGVKGLIEKLIKSVVWFVCTAVSTPPPFWLGDPAICGSHSQLPGHPIVLLYTRGFFCVCLLYCCISCCLLFLGFLYFCSVFSFSTLILLVGSFDL